MIDNKYRISKNLGYGWSSKVFLVEDEQGNKFAAKVIRKDKNYEDAFAKRILTREHEIWTELGDHPNIINSYSVNFNGVFEWNGKTQNILYNIIEYAPNRTLSEFIRNTGAVEEEVARFFMSQLLHAVEYMHHQGYAHLDIKLENILLDEFFNIKLADFGSSLYLAESNGFTNLRRGTKFYLPPEVENETGNEAYNGYSADVYTLGISLFLLLAGEFPSEEGMDCTESSTTVEESVVLKEDNELDKWIKAKWKGLSTDVKALIQSMINPIAYERPTISELLETEWFQAPFSCDIFNNVFDEMHARKVFMIEKCQKSFY